MPPFGKQQEIQMKLRSAYAWDREFLVCALAALAVSKGFALIAEAIQELGDSTGASFLREIRG